MAQKVKRLANVNEYVPVNTEIVKE